MGMVEARTCEVALIPPGKKMGDPRLVRSRGPRPPRLGNQRDLPSFELDERPDVARTVNDDLVPIEGRKLVRHDAHEPAGCVRLAPSRRQGEYLRGRSILTTLAERARLELGRGRVFQLGPGRPRATGPSRCHCHAAPADRIDADVQAQLWAPAFVRSRNGFNRSSGAGKTIVVDCEAPSSRSRK